MQAAQQLRKPGGTRAPVGRGCRSLRPPSARPPLFRALGPADPPSDIEIDGGAYRLVEILKHDSWACTALYAGTRGRVVCKFNRQQAVGRMPMRWLGRMLAQREASMLERLADLPNVPDRSGEVVVAGQRLDYAVAHEYVPGHPLGRRERVADEFFPTLETLLSEIHRRGAAYVDLHKRENIIVGDNGQPYLIDFQISFSLPPWWIASTAPMRTLLRVLQLSDDYHLRKHIARLRPDQVQGEVKRPWWIRVHRFVAIPFRAVRRRLLVALGIRSGRGLAGSEQFVEDALRPDAS